MLESNDQLKLIAKNVRRPNSNSTYYALERENKARMANRWGYTRWGIGIRKKEGKSKG
jgi:hypothetical protein